MDKFDSYTTDDGHYMSFEDYISYVKWKVNNLINEGWDEESIKNFIDDNTWAYYSALLYNNK